jgi:uncharacterized protein YbaP (TraB family)
LCHPSLRRLITSVSFLFLSAFSATIAAVSEPAFWVASKGVSKVYLFGSMHFGRQDFYPLPEVVEQAFTESSRLAVEVNLLHLGANAQQILFRHAALPKDTGLKDVISPETYAALTEQANRNQVPISAFHRFQPWYITLTLVEAEIRKTDLQQQLGLDLYFLRRAAASNKSVAELETFESQLGLFSSISFEDQEKFLSQTLADLQHSRNYLKAAADAWVLGDIEVLDKTLIEPFRDQKDARFLFDKMFTQRNVKMSKAVTHYLEEGEKTFMVVGVGHMLGENGIIRQLRSQGFSIRRIPTNGRAADTTSDSMTTSLGTGLP